MKRLLILRESFGPSVADGAEAHAFQQASLAPLLEGGDDLILDFTGIRSANSSFVNGLLRGLFAEHGEELLRRITFKGCLPAVQVLVQGAIELGLMHHGEAAKPRQALR